MRKQDLTAVERRVWEAYEGGERVDLRVGDPALDDPEQSDSWGSDRMVRAQVLASLLTRPMAARLGNVAALRLAGARIQGSLNLDYAHVVAPALFTACDFPDGVNLRDAHTRHLSFQDTRLAHLDADGIAVDGNLEIRSCAPLNRTELYGARVAGELIIDKTRLVGTEGVALAAGRIQVEGRVWLFDIYADGEVDLRHARIGDDVELRGSRLRNPGGVAFAGSRIQIRGDLHCENLEAVGQVKLGGAKIGGIAFFFGARLSYPGDMSLNAYGLEVGADLYLNEGFSSQGGVHLPGASIGGVMMLDGAVLDGCGQLALNLTDARISRLDLRTAAAPIGRVYLLHAVIGTLVDDPSTWTDEFRLDGLRYDALAVPLRAVERMPWLTLGSAGSSQPYEQLASVYRTLGRDDQARIVLLARQRLRYGALPWYAQLWGMVQNITVGYGYRPVRAVVWLLALLVIGSVVFGIDRPSRAPSANVGNFNPVIFTLDHLLPVINFGQGSAFIPKPGTQWLAYGLTAAGWLLATTIVTGITRTLNRA